jgi:signal transduction histidine kinase
MRSERLKTELITNVSHDIKTPLTSIINYADLISAEETDNPRITEYSQVLLRQSERLKKLLEDLLEASKATTGNLEVDLKPCEVGVLLTQAVGEYQKRMEERHLELRTSQPEEPVRVMADGRHLWRVFDNLLNNICKYAQENSRVYVSVEMREKKVHIIFRNMSKYALDISGEELEERFVRGDRSRHMEGNGLGLSIAKSLTELLNGSMTIVTDGDLFKVMLEFSGVD